uniref:Uncharacterized protein n=1 Tax=Ciona savignyi TaxID=51511 RepID=H2ZGP6_CIOSA
MLFHGIKDITYDFHHYQHHHQHIENYRNSYTYILIRNFRELRASGLAGVKLQAALRLKLSNTSSKKYTEEICRGLLHTHRECQHHTTHSSPAPTKKPPVTPPPVVYYSENCPTGPVLYNRTGSSKSTSSKSSDVLLSTVNPSAICCGGCMTLPKSTMEVNPMVIKSSQQRPFGEQETGYKGHKTVKSPKPWKPQSTETVGKRKTNQTNQMSMVVGSSAFGGKAKQGGVRKMSPLGKVPVAIRRSSPSIRGRRDPSGTAVEGAKYLSIAMATHTVTSPYYHSNDGHDDSVPMM